MLQFFTPLPTIISNIALTFNCFYKIIVLQDYKEMVNLKKVIGIILVLCLSLAFLTGCTEDEKALWDAYKKTGNANSYAFTAELSLSADTSGITDPNAALTLGVINTFKMQISGSAIMNADKSAVKLKLVTNTQLMGSSYPVTFWADADFSDANHPKYIAVYELPDMLKSLMLNGAAGYDKQYYYMDMADLYTDAGMALNFQGMLNTSKLWEALEKMDTTGISAEKKGETYIATIKNGAILPLFEEYLKAMTAITPELSAIDTEALDFSEVFAPLQKIDLLGGKDLVSSYTIGSDGYLDSMTLDLDLVIDPKQIAESAGTDANAAGMTDVIKIGIKMLTKYADINKVTSVELPALTRENSLNIQAIGREDEIAVYINGMRVIFDVPPQLENDRTFVPLRRIFEKLGASVEYIAATESIVAIKGDRRIDHKIGENVFYLNGSAIQSDAASFVRNGRTLVPARVISEALGADVEWDQATQSVLITY